MKPSRSIPSDRLATRKNPATAGVKGATRKGSSVIPALVIPALVSTNCVKCEEKGVPRKPYAREVRAFLLWGKWPVLPFYGACREHTETVQGIAEKNDPTPEERYALENCWRVGVDSVAVLVGALDAALTKRQRMTRKEMKQFGARRYALRLARLTDPDAGWKEWAKMAGYPNGEAARKDFLRARQGGTKPKTL